ncbi:MAG TPA: HAMP domain-containing sensor histidine kinase, partial [Longimicrobium sp.]|nr:HAMP domain-containing sensor histidine kinase [Longimicrobium sp.]
MTGRGDDEAARLRAEAAALRERVEALEGRLAETERASEEKTRMVGHVSHELRAPLGSILGFASLLAAEPEMAPERREEYVGIVLRNARHLLHVVNDILNLSKVEAGTLEVSLAPIRAGDLAAAVAASLEPVAAERGVTLAVDDGARHRALADAGRLRQVLLNLLDNAIKYSPPGSPVEVRLRSGGGEVRIEVADAGPGLREEDQARLFREFSRVSHAGFRVPGAGLGLALAKRLAEAMGGRIGVESAPGRGSTFWVALPAA